MIDYYILFIKTYFYCSFITIILDVSYKHIDLKKIKEVNYYKLNKKVFFKVMINVFIISFISIYFLSYLINLRSKKYSFMDTIIDGKRSVTKIS